MAETIQKGIGAVFQVAGETKAMRDFFSIVRSAGVQAIDPKTAHITIVDSAETQISVFSKRDQMSLNRALARAGEYLSTLPYYELILSPAAPQLENYGRRVGIPIEEKDFLLGVRKYVGDIFQEEAGISMSHRSYEPHLSVGLKSRSPNAAVKRVNNQRIPRRLHVLGYNVGERTYVEDPARQRSSQRYLNSVPFGSAGR